MATGAVIPDLLRRYVLWPDEEIERVRDWPDGVAVATGMRHFVAGSEVDDWLVGRADWVADVLVAVRDDIVVSGQPERFAFLVPVGGGEIYLNDPDTLAALGQRMPERLEPLAYAELLVAFHRYSSAVAAVLTEPDELPRRYGRPDLPEIEPFRAGPTPPGFTMTFTAAARYRRPLVGNLLDLTRWRVEVPAGLPARWATRSVAEGLRLDPSAGVAS